MSLPSSNPVISFIPPPSKRSPTRCCSHFSPSRSIILYYCKLDLIFLPAPIHKGVGCFLYCSEPVAIQGKKCFKWFPSLFVTEPVPPSLAVYAAHMKPTDGPAAASLCRSGQRSLLWPARQQPVLNALPSHVLMLGTFGCFACSKCCRMLPPIISLSIAASPNHPLHLIDQ